MKNNNVDLSYDPLFDNDDDTVHLYSIPEDEDDADSLLNGSRWDEDAE